MHRSPVALAQTILASGFGGGDGVAGGLVETQGAGEGYAGVDLSGSEIETDECERCGGGGLRTRGGGRGGGWACARGAEEVPG